MPFPWYESDVPEEFRSASDKALSMYLGELRTRAALLMRLGYSPEDAKLRLRGNVRWDFELHGQPPHLQQVDAIVEKVYSTRSTGVGGPPSLDG